MVRGAVSQVYKGKYRLAQMKEQRVLRPFLVVSQVMDRIPLTFPTRIHLVVNLPARQAAKSLASLAFHREYQILQKRMQLLVE